MRMERFGATFNAVNARLSSIIPPMPVALSTAPWYTLSPLMGTPIPKWSQCEV